jgi:arylsulfatase A-like enzyme
LRGGKYSAYDGGTRIPFLVQWPGKVAPGVSDAMVSQVDLLASLASFTSQKLPTGAAPDSIDVMPAVLGKQKRGRSHVVEHATALSLIVGDWKVIQPHAGPQRNATGNEIGNDPQPQLFNLKGDIGEMNNVAVKYPEKVKEMLVELSRIQSGRGDRF